MWPSEHLRLSRGRTLAPVYFGVCRLLVDLLQWDCPLTGSLPQGPLEEIAYIIALYGNR